jgi:cell division protein FtsB
MNMDHAGEHDSGDEVEVDDIEIVAEIDEAFEAVEHEQDEHELDVAEHDVVEPIEVGTEQRTVSRDRHPAGAAALAKRVAMDRPTRIGVASLVFVALMFVFVFPTRSYLAQQRQVKDARHSVQVLRTQNAQLAREATRLQTDSEVERLARSQFNMVFEGEEAYNVVPPRGTADTTTTVP